MEPNLILGLPLVFSLVIPLAQKDINFSTCIHNLLFPEMLSFMNKYFILPLISHKLLVMVVCHLLHHLIHHFLYLFLLTIFLIFQFFYLLFHHMHLINLTYPHLIFTIIQHHLNLIQLHIYLLVQYLFLNQKPQTFSLYLIIQIQKYSLWMFLFHPFSTF
jgi:hypothetical protein